MIKKLIKFVVESAMRRIRLRLRWLGLLAACCVLLIPAPAHAEWPGMTQKERDIEKLVRLSGQADASVQVMDEMLSDMKEMAPEVPAAIWREYRRRLTADAFIQISVKVYDRHFTHEEIQQLVRFYETPLGRKLVRVTPAMTRESMLLGEEIGERVMQDILKEYFAE